MKKAKKDFTPKISVVMSCFNEEKYIKQAIKSILDQTYSDFEFIIINDCSTDKTEDIIKSFKDPRIVCIKNKKNLGITKSLNIGFKKATGEYIVRMDANDISVNNRFALQVNFLENNKNIGLCGGWVEIIGGDIKKTWKYPTEHKEIMTQLFFHNAIAHPTVMIRKSKLNLFDLRYNEQFNRIQDYDMWVRCSRKFELSNIPDVILKYRLCKQDIKNKFWNKQTQQIINNIRKSQLDELGVSYTPEQLQLHHDISNKKYTRSQKFLSESRRWFEILKTSNRQKKLLPEPAFSKLLDKKYDEIETWVNMSIITRGAKWLQYYRNRYVK